MLTSTSEWLYYFNFSTFTNLVGVCQNSLGDRQHSSIVDIHRYTRCTRCIYWTSTHQISLFSCRVSTRVQIILPSTQLNNRTKTYVSTIFITHITRKCTWAEYAAGLELFFLRPCNARDRPMASIKWQELRKKFHALVSIRIFFLLKRLQAKDQHHRAKAFILFKIYFKRWLNNKNKTNLFLH